MEAVVLHRIGFLAYSCPKQGQDFKPSAAPLYPNMGQVPPPRGFSCEKLCSSRELRYFSSCLCACGSREVPVCEHVGSIKKKKKEDLNWQRMQRESEEVFVSKGEVQFVVKIMYEQLHNYVQLHIQRTNFLHIPLHGETRPITHHITCNSKNLIYMIQCKRCHKQTRLNYKDHFNEHRRPVDKPTNISKPNTVPEHFLTDHHTGNDILLIPLELVHSNRDSVRKTMEAYLITRGNTLQPLALNKRDEM